jgi:hypothetical protein
VRKGGLGCGSVHIESQRPTDAAAAAAPLSSCGGSLSIAPGPHCCPRRRRRRRPSQPAHMTASWKTLSTPVATNRPPCTPHSERHTTPWSEVEGGGLRRKAGSAQGRAKRGPLTAPAVEVPTAAATSGWPPDPPGALTAPRLRACAAGRGHRRSRARPEGRMGFWRAQWVFGRGGAGRGPPPAKQRAGARWPRRPRAALPPKPIRALTRAAVPQRSDWSRCFAAPRATRPLQKKKKRREGQGAACSGTQLAGGAGGAAGAGFGGWRGGKPRAAGGGCGAATGAACSQWPRRRAAATRPRARAGADSRLPRGPRRPLAPRAPPAAPRPAAHLPPSAPASVPMKRPHARPRQPGGRGAAASGAPAPVAGGGGSDAPGAAPPVPPSPASAPPPPPRRPRRSGIPLRVRQARRGLFRAPRGSVWGGVPGHGGRRGGRRGRRWSGMG